MNEKQKKNVTLGALMVSAVGGIILLSQRKKSTSQVNSPGLPPAPIGGLSRGFRNNNPGNIRIGSSKWIGKLTPNKDGSFEQFDTMENGIRALFVLLRTYIGQGNNTLAKIISKYAPSIENNTSAYLNFVVSKTLHGVGAVVDFANKAVITKVVYAIIWYENGTPLPLAQIERVYETSFS